MLSTYKKITLIPFSAYLVGILFSCASSEQNHLKESIEQLHNEQLPAAQRIQKVDSLIQYPFHSPIASEEMYKLYEIKRDALFELNEVSEAVTTNDKIIQLAESLHDTLAISEAMVFFYLKDADKTFSMKYNSYYPKILSFTEKHAPPITHARNLILYAQILKDNSKYEEAEHYHLMAERIFRRYRSEIDLVKVYLGLGNIMLASQYRDKASIHYTKALEESRRINNTDLIASSLMNLAISKKISNPDSSLKLYNEALSLITKSDQDFLRIKVKFNISNIYKAKGNLRKTEQILREILDDCIKQGYEEGVCVVTSSLGMLYAEQGKLEKSVALLESARNKTDSLQLKGLSNALLPDLIDIYKQTNQYEKAFRASQELISHKDSSISLEKQKAILDLESKFMAELKDVENAQLLRINHLWEILTWGLCIVLFLAVTLYFRNIKYDTEKQKAQLYLVNFYKKQIQKANTPTHSVANSPLSSKLNYLLLTQKPFTNPTVSLQSLAASLHVSQEDLLADIKIRGFKSFDEFIHFHRIQEAKVLLESVKSRDINTIFFEVGFTNKHYFDLIFEEVTGLKSKFYLKNVIQK